MFLCATQCVAFRFNPEFESLSKQSVYIPVSVWVFPLTLQKSWHLAIEGVFPAQCLWRRLQIHHDPDHDKWPVTEDQWVFVIWIMLPACLLYSFETWYSKGLYLSPQESMLKRSSLNGRVTTTNLSTITHIYNGKVASKIQVLNLFKRKPKWNSQCNLI